MEQYVPDELFSDYAVIVSVYVGLHKYDSALICGKKSLELLKANYLSRHRVISKQVDQTT
jgi:hypothetical protein